MVFNNSILLGAAGQGGAVEFDPTLISNSIWLDGSADFLSRQNGSDFANRKEVTISFWVQRNELGSQHAIFAGVEGSQGFIVQFMSGDTFQLHLNGTANLTTNAVFRDIGWYHILVSIDTSQAVSSDRSKVYINGEQITSFSSAAYPSQNSNIPGISGQMTSSETMRIGNYNNSVSNFYFNKGYVTQACMIESKSIQQGDFAVSDFLDTFTFGTNGSQIIPKKDSDIAALASAAGGNSFCLNFSSASVALSSGVTPTSNAGTFSGSLSNLTDGNFTTDWRSNVDPATNVDNDHIAFDLGSAKDVKAVKVTGRSSITGNFKVQFSDNGSDFTDTGTTFSNVSITTTANSGILDLTSDNPGSHRYWKLINISNSSGTSAWGFKQIILDSAVGNLGTDASGNGNDFTLTSIDSNNQSTHTPSRTYLQLNFLQKFGTADLSEGNTRVGVDVSDSIRGTKYATTGKKYLEVTLNTVNNSYIGVANGSNNPSSFASSNVACLQKDGDIYINDSVLGSSRSKTFGTGDVVGILIDADAKKFWQSVNGTFNSLDRDSSITLSASDILAGTGGFDLSGLTGDDGNYVLHIGNSDGTSADVSINGGHKAFSHTPPTGYTGWASDDYTAPDFQGIDYFDTTLYEGNGGVQRVGDFVPFTDAYTVDKSAMFDYGDKRYLSFTPDSGGNQKTFTISFWFKLTGASDPSNVQSVISVGTTGGKQAQIRFEGSVNSQNLNINAYNGSSFLLNLDTDRKFAPSDGWTHAVFAVDTRTGVATANKVKIYIDGVQQTATGTQLSTDDYDTLFNANQEHNIGRQTNNAIGEPDIYFAEMVMVEDQQLDPTSFGQVDTSTNRWVPKDVSGLTFGAEGWYLEFDGTSFGSGGSGETPANGAGKDSSGNNNHWEEENDSGSDWSTSDQFTDTPSKNFDTLSGRSSGSPTITQGNTLATIAAGGKQIRSTFNLNAGKWYVEVDIQATNNSASVGLVPSRSATFANGPGRDANGGISYETDGDVFSDNVQNATAEASFAAGDVVQMAIDMNAKKVYFGKNNTFGGDPAAGTGGHFLPESIISDGAAVITLGGYSGSQAATMQINYGQFLVFDGGSTTNGFKFTPPTGFKAVNQDNLDDTASKITAWAWLKNMDANDNHMLYDRVRGITADLHTNNANAETTDANSVQRFLQRGVQIGNKASLNTANESYALWQWLAGDSATTGTVFSADNPPSLASTVIAADADHFSVGTYTGDGGTSATIKHGLSAAPEMIWVKNRSAADEWLVGTEHNGFASPWNYYAHLETTGNFAANSNAWNNTAPTSSVFTVGTSDRCNASGENYVFYAFRSVPGVCKVGSFIGNFDHDGPYIHLGFKPAWYMTKDASTTSSWYIYDSANYPFNSTSVFHVLANSNNAGGAGAFNEQDLLSDGVKNRGQNNDTNESGSTFLYLAMAEIAPNGAYPPIYGR